MRHDTPVSRPVVYDRVELPSSDARGVETEVEATVSGNQEHIEISGANIDSKLFYPNAMVTGRFKWLCNTYEDILVEPVRVKNGIAVSIRIKYMYGVSDIHNPNLEISIAPA
jgi:hypothetical protein